MSWCTHAEFTANAEVQRITDSGQIPIVVSYAADITVRCAHCGEPFAFVGLPGGVSPLQPTVSVGGCTLRAPIRPQSGRLSPIPG